MRRPDALRKARADGALLERRLPRHQHRALEHGPLHLGVLRFACAALILLVLLRLRVHRMPRPSPRETVLIIGLGILGISVYNVLFSAGLQLVEASRAALIVPTNPAFTALFAAIFSKSA